MNTLQTLTEREERFVEHYSIHKKPSDAYRYAYTTENMSADTIASEAYVVRTRPHVAYRLYEIQVAAQELIVVSVAEKKQWLKTIVEENIKMVYSELLKRDILTGDQRAAISAISELNKMDGDLAAQKKEFSGVDGLPITTHAMDQEGYKQARLAMLETDDC